MRKAAHLPQRQQATVDDAGMVILIGDDHVASADQAGDHPQIRLVTRAEN